MGDLTKNEDGCMYYGWAIKDDKLFCREAYVDAKAVQAHLDNIVPAVGEMLIPARPRSTTLILWGPRRAGARSRRAPTRWAPSTGTSTRPSRNSRCPASSSAPSPSRPYAFACRLLVGGLLTTTY